MPLMSSSTLESIAAGAGLVTISGFTWLSLITRGTMRKRAVRRRERKAHAAAVEASLVDDAFAPESIEAVVDELISLASDLWDGTPPRVKRVDAPLIESWAQRLLDQWGAGLRVLGRPAVHFEDVINRGSGQEDRVILRVHTRVRHNAQVAVGDGHTLGLDERWTLNRPHGAWLLTAIESGPFADHAPEGKLVSAAWADKARLREQALAELASGDQVSDTDLAGLVSAESAPSQQLIELSVLDQRFDTQVLSATIDHIVDAWEEASAGPHSPLAMVATPSAVELLLHPPSHGGNNRFMLHDAAVERWRPTRLQLLTRPPRIEISLTVSAVRYLVKRSTGHHLAGSIDARHTIELIWTLALSTRTPLPWQLVQTTNPAKDIS